MQLTSHSDFALRVLMYLGCYPEKRITIREISSAYAISHNHLMKVVQKLSQNGLLDATRGRSGGLKLGKNPEDIVVGDVIRTMEPHFDLVECFDASSSKCILSPACQLQSALHEAREAFLKCLDAYTLGDLLVAPNSIRELLYPSGLPTPPNAPLPINDGVRHQPVAAHGSAS